MKSLPCLLGRHDWIRGYRPGHVFLTCLICGAETPGLRGPTVTVEPPVVTRRRKKPTKAPVVRLEKRRTA